MRSRVLLLLNATKERKICQKDRPMSTIKAGPKTRLYMSQRSEPVASDETDLSASSTGSDHSDELRSLRRLD